MALSFTIMFTEETEIGKETETLIGILESRKGIQVRDCFTENPIDKKPYISLTLTSIPEFDTADEGNSFVEDVVGITEAYFESESVDRKVEGTA